MPFYLAAALAGVAVVGVAFIVVIELAEWHQREEERRLMQWTAERRGSAGSGGAVREQEQREARSSAWEEGEKKDGMRRRGQRVSLICYTSRERGEGATDPHFVSMNFAPRTGCSTRAGPLPPHRQRYRSPSLP